MRWKNAPLEVDENDYTEQGTKKDKSKSMSRITLNVLSVHIDIFISSLFLIPC